MSDNNQPTLGPTSDDQRGVSPAQIRGQREPTRGVHAGIPNNVRFTCQMAERGVTGGYASVGWHLASAVVCQVPHDVELAEWLDQIKTLERHAAADDRRAIVSWFAAHYPKAMELIPAQHRDQFAAGVRQAWEEDRLVL